MNEPKKSAAAIAASFVKAGTPCDITDNPDAMLLTYADGAQTTVTRGDIEDHGLLLVCAWHGAKQKLVDAAAISRDPETGKAATLETKRAAVNEVFERLTSGQWYKVRGEGSGGSGGLLYRALVRMYAGRKTAEEIKTYLEARTDAEKAALRKTPKVAAIIEEIRAESADAAGIDGNELLAGLED